MKKEFKPHEYQRRGMEWIMQHPFCALFWDMGLGKSVTTLTAIARLIDTLEVQRALIVAPAKVMESTWTGEADKWAHLSWLRVIRIMGTPAQRLKALHTPADVYCISRDSFQWLAELDRPDKFPFDIVVLDELTSFKSPRARRFKAFRKIRPFLSRVVGLTGTPAPNGLIDLWAQLYCIDGGERLGRFVTKYRDTYFSVFMVNHIPIRITARPKAADTIRGKISDICMTLRADELLTLPPLQVIDERVALPEAAAKRYREFERERVMEFNPGESDKVIAASAAALMNKLSQFANGAIYDETGGVREIHAAKLERLAEIVEAAGGPVLVFYKYRHDIPRIHQALKGFRTAVYSGDEELKKWNAGEYDALLAHPASTAFGLNMQSGGNVIVWFGLDYNLELYQQANARLYRQGQQHRVTVYHLIAAGTADEIAAAALTRKATVQGALLEGLAELFRIYNR